MLLLTNIYFSIYNKKKAKKVRVCRLCQQQHPVKYIPSNGCSVSPRFWISSVTVRLRRAVKSESLKSSMVVWLSGTNTKESQLAMMQRQEYRFKVVFYDTLKKVFVVRKKKYVNPFKVFHASFSYIWTAFLSFTYADIREKSKLWYHIFWG